jgi:RNA polymerase sigma-70 factor, ECF subfamily
VGGSTEGDPTASHTTPPLGAADVSRIVREHGDFVWRTLRRLGVRDADVDDVCQEVFVVLNRKLKDFEPRASIKSWLYGICVRSAAAHRRKASTRREVPTESPNDAERAPGPDASYEGKEALAMLDRALDELDGDKRDVFVLYEIEELTMPEVAGIVDCPLQTAYSRHRAARELVTAFLRRSALAPGGGR